MQPKAIIRETIIDLLKKRSSGATICPSEVPRQLYPDEWRDYMELTREVAHELSMEGIIEICQRGIAVDPEKKFKGPIRLRLKD